MPRYALLFHRCPSNYQRSSHWDLMLEVGEVLHTWALAELPAAWRETQRATAVIEPACAALAANNSVAAEQLSHHRPAYLDFEGPLSGDRGYVTRIDRGSYRIVRQSPGFWQGELTGGFLRGEIRLQQQAEPQNWLLIADAGDRP